MPRNLILILGTIIVIALVTAFFGSRTPKVQISDSEPTSEIKANPAPNFTFVTIDGKISQLTDLKGKPVILHFWATWCPPCVVEIPSLFKMARANQNRLNVVAVSLDLNRDTLNRFLRRQELVNQVNLFHVWDEKKKISNDIFQSYFLPETIIIDARGRMVKKIAGSIDWQNKDDMSFLNDEKLYEP